MSDSGVLREPPAHGESDDFGLWRVTWQVSSRATNRKHCVSQLSSINTGDRWLPAVADAARARPRRAAAATVSSSDARRVDDDVNDSAHRDSSAAAANDDDDDDDDDESVCERRTAAVAVARRFADALWRWPACAANDDDDDDDDDGAGRAVSLRRAIGAADNVRADDERRRRDTATAATACACGNRCRASARRRQRAGEQEAGV